MNGNTQMPELLALRKVKLGHSSPALVSREEQNKKQHYKFIFTAPFFIEGIIKQKVDALGKIVAGNEKKLYLELVSGVKNLGLLIQGLEVKGGIHSFDRNAIATALDRYDACPETANARIKVLASLKEKN